MSSTAGVWVPAWKKKKALADAAAATAADGPSDPSSSEHPSPETKGGLPAADSSLAKQRQVRSGTHHVSYAKIQTITIKT